MTHDDALQSPSSDPEDAPLPKAAELSEEVRARLLLRRKLAYNGLEVSEYQVRDGGYIGTYLN